VNIVYSLVEEVE